MSSESGPNVSVRWVDGERFDAEARGHRVVLDGEGSAGPSPMDTALIALAACMGIDIVDILEKGRQAITGCEITVSSERRPDPPRRFTSIRLEIALEGEIDRAKAERAVALSRDTYCSVWNSMAPDIEFDARVSLSG